MLSHYYFAFFVAVGVYGVPLLAHVPRRPPEITDNAKYLNSESRDRVAFWLRRIEDEFGVSVRIETHQSIPSTRPGSKINAALIVEEDLISWANEKVAHARPTEILLLVIRERGLVVLSVGTKLLSLGEFDLEARRPIVSFLEKNLALNNPEVALVGAMRMLYAALHRKLISGAFDTPQSESGFDDVWNRVLPWTAVTVLLTLLLLSFLFYFLLKNLLQQALQNSSKPGQFLETRDTTAL